MIDHGVILAKFWLHITPEEQLKRFHEREATPYKQYKITDEDWRNREKWGDYEQAVQDMVVRTSTDEAPGNSFLQTTNHLPASKSSSDFANAWNMA